MNLSVKGLLRDWKFVAPNGSRLSESQAATIPAPAVAKAGELAIATPRSGPILLPDGTLYVAPSTLAVPPAKAKETPMSTTQQITEDAIKRTEASQPVSKPKKESFLTHVGEIFRKAFHVGEVAAVAAEPFLKIVAPEIAPIYQTAIGLATAAEATVVNATGTGPQKLASVVATLVPQAQAWAKANNINWPEDGINKWASVVVDSLNMVPAPTAPPTSNT